MWLIEIELWIQVSFCTLVQEGYLSLVKNINNFLVGSQVQKFWIGDDPSRNVLLRVGERESV